MTDAELEKLLRAVPVPDREPEYWEDFPRSVTRALRRTESSTATRPGGRRRMVWVWAGGLAAVCVLAGFLMGFWRGRESGLQANQVAAMQTYLREVEALFPNQVRAIVVDEKGPRLVLSEKPDVLSATPLLLKISGGGSSRSVVTFSGQAIQVNGDLCEVLTDAAGQVLLVGEKWIWSSAAPAQGPGHTRIQAQSLDTL